MKKLILFTFVLISLFSCSKRLEDASLTTNKNELKSAGDGMYDILGYGCDPTKDYLELSQQMAQVIDVKKLVTEQSGSYIDIPANRNFTDFLSGSDALDFSSNFNIKVDGSLTVKLLTASANADVRYGYKINKKRSYATMFNKILLKEMRLSCTKDILKNYLTTALVNDLNTLSADAIVNKYGTHVYTDIFIGGKLEFDYSSVTTSETKNLAVSAGAKSSIEKVFSFSYSGSYDQTLVTTNTSVQSSCHTIGGDPGKSIYGEINLTTPNMTLNVNNWSSSITLSNAQVIDIGDHSLIPLYELIADNTKAEQVRQASIQYLTQHDINSIDGTIKCTFSLTHSNDRAISLDFNGDGIKDLLFYSPGNRTAFLNAGFKDGTFYNIVANSSGIYNYDLANVNDQIISLDFNGDGKDDLMCYRPGSKIVYLLKSNGDGTFSPIYSSANGIGTFDFADTKDRAIALDYNGDHKVDLMCYRPGSKIVYLLKGNGDGIFTNIYSSANGIGNYDFAGVTDQAIALDYNGDGRDDLMCYRPGSKYVYILRSNGDGTYDHVYGSANGIGGFDFSSNMDRAIALDYNGDKLSDIICYRPGYGNFNLLRSNGNGTYGRVLESSGIASYDLKDNRDQIISLDYNNDGLSDIILYRPGIGYAYSARSLGTSSLFTRDFSE
jgi:MAC/Perforin domain.